MRILITGHRANDLSGAELYLRDIALELLRQGHTPAVYTSSLGRVARELTAAGIPVACSPKRLDFEPEVIHGHHFYETLAAVLHFPDAPAVFICHDHMSWMDKPPLHSRVLRYCGVSNLCLDRLHAAGIPPVKTSRLHNFVDLERFRPRAPLPDRPRRALVFSNYATDATYLPVVAEACRQAGLEMDVMGSGAGSPIERPEEVLGQYDIVFAKARAAMEAMAVGAAVVLCDFGGVGPMVTSGNFAELRPLNFGFQALTQPHTATNLLRQIALYDARDASRVRDLIRSSAGLEHAVVGLVDTYRQIIAQYDAAPSKHPVLGDTRRLFPMAAHRVVYGLQSLWQSVSPDRRHVINNHVVGAVLKRGMKRVLGGRPQD